METAVLAFILAAAAASAAGSEISELYSPPIGCVGELVALSPCLPFLAPPTEIDSLPPPPASCCEAFLVSALDGVGVGAACVCHLVRDPDIFGFPINESRLLSLFSSCGLSNAIATPAFLDLCLEAEMLPPLRSDKAYGETDDSSPSPATANSNSDPGVASSPGDSGQSPVPCTDTGDAIPASEISPAHEAPDHSTSSQLLVRSTVPFLLLPVVLCCL